jgi:hypothetical protein
MKAKITKYGENKDLWFLCPACKVSHTVRVEGGINYWDWNKSLESPTISPSILTWWNEGDKAFRCHSFVTDGRILFCDDSNHSLAGKTVDLPELTDDSVQY